MYRLLAAALLCAACAAHASPDSPKNMDECRTLDTDGQQRMEEALARDKHQKPKAAWLKPHESAIDAIHYWEAQTEKVRQCQMKLPGARIGMTPKQVQEETNWGYTSEVHTTTTAAGTTEQWVYKSGYLYFTNGRLTAIQN